MSDLIENYKKGVMACLAEINKAEIHSVARIIVDACQKKKRVYIFGNGGSATTASHFVCDLVKVANTNKNLQLPIISLTDKIALITAIANNISGGCPHGSSAYYFQRSETANKGK